MIIGIIISLIILRLAWTLVGITRFNLGIYHGEWLSALTLAIAPEFWIVMNVYDRFRYLLRRMR